jgi:monovalent cation:H+ antiporter-2, CPA2 family
MILFNDLLIIVGLSVLVLYLCSRLKIPIVVGFLLTGLITGPHGLALVGDLATVQVWAEVGVVLLLFTIGLEFSFRSLLHIKRSVFLGGSLQVLLTTAAAFAVARYFGRPVGESVLIGFLVSLSSTAIVLKILQDRAELETPQGNTALGILIFQDILAVPMMLLVPLLAGEQQGGMGAVLLFLAKVAAVILLLVIGAKWIVPWVFHGIARTKSRELFLLSVIATCLAVAWLTNAAGLSLALGAFLAGLVISESEYSHQALGNILPFRDVFTSFFFVSIGMLLNLDFVLEHPAALALLAFGVLAFKTAITSLAAVFLGLPLRTVILVGVSLSQVGEFSFILSEKALQHGLLVGEMHQVFLAVSVLTMMASPFALTAAPTLSSWILRLPLPARIKKGAYPVAGTAPAQQRGHLIIVGFGLNGRNLARAAKFSGIPYVIIEMNPTVVKEERAKGEPIQYGDATQEAILAHANLGMARAVVVVINDPAATRRVTELVRRLNPTVYLVVRTRFLQEMAPLAELGADEVIPEEFETSVEIFSRILSTYLMPQEEIEKFIAEIRSERYGMLRSLSPESTSCRDIRQCLPDAEIRALRIGEGSPFVGKTPAETEMRRELGVTLLALRHQEQIISNPGPETVFHPGDILFILGKPEQILAAVRLFKSPETPDGEPPAEG